MANSRVTRGRITQSIFADYIRALFPHVDTPYGSEPGVDIKNTTGWAIECKATKEIPGEQALDQAEKNAQLDDIPIVVYRGNQQGPAKVGEWRVILRARHWRRIAQARHDCECGAWNDRNPSTP